MLTRTIFNEGGLPDLEPADRALVDRLVADPRASGRDLAKALDCSEANISRRLNRLVAEHAVRIRAFMSLDRAGLSAGAVMLVQSPDPMALGQRLAAHEWIHFVATTGPLDGPANALVLHGSAANGTAFRALLDRDLVTDPDVTVVDARMVLDSFGTQATTDAHRHNWRGGRPLDRVNRAIIRELQRDGRATFAALGEVAGISSTAAAERYRHLIDDQLIRMLAFPEPSRIGLRATGLMLVRPRIATSEALEAARSVANPGWIAMLSGPSLIALECSAADDRALVALTDRVGALPGISNAALCPYHAILKESFVWCGADEE
ncbi:MAG: Lrp/AsnC family transcriptional regulator [Planctomycetes bacterium]|nr:Lrp/AsnC family transcriptional regulator [Planctomycetota bacterium]